MRRPLVTTALIALLAAPALAAGPKAAKPWTSQKELRNDRTHYGNVLMRPRAGKPGFVTRVKMLWTINNTWTQHHEIVVKPMKNGQVELSAGMAFSLPTNVELRPSYGTTGKRAWDELHFNRGVTEMGSAGGETYYFVDGRAAGKNLLLQAFDRVSGSKPITVSVRPARKPAKQYTLALQEDLHEGQYGGITGSRFGGELRVELNANRDGVAKVWHRSRANRQGRFSHIPFISSEETPAVIKAKHGSLLAIGNAGLTKLRLLSSEGEIHRYWGALHTDSFFWGKQRTRDILRAHPSLKETTDFRVIELAGGLDKRSDLRLELHYGDTVRTVKLDLAP